MRNRIKTAAAVCGVVIMCGALAACKHHGSSGDHGEKAKEHMNATLKKIGASEDQRTKISGVMDVIVADGQQLRTENREIKGAIVACLLQDTPDRIWLHATVDEKARTFTGFAHRTVDRLVEISAMLTPQQRTVLKDRFASSHGAEK